MKKNLTLVVNPRSSGFELIQKKILPFLDETHFEKGSFKTFEIQPTSPMKNAHEMAKGLKDDDIILVAGGDGTAHIAANAVAISGKKNIKIKFTGFGNFNDYAHSFSKNSGKAAIKSFEILKVQAKIRPIELKINGEFFRYAPLYATVGLTAEMAEIFEGGRIRKVLKKVYNRNIRLILSLSAATRFYFKHCRNHILNLSKIKINDKDFLNIPQNPTDIVFMNGPRMARIMRSSINKKESDNFGFEVLNSAGLIRNSPFLMKGFFGKIPLKRADRVEIAFRKPQNIVIQIEGEVCKIKKVQTIEAKISDKIIEIL